MQVEMLIMIFSLFKLKEKWTSVAAKFEERWQITVVGR
jgi:hypothetical protein